MDQKPYNYKSISGCFICPFHDFTGEQSFCSYECYNGRDSATVEPKKIYIEGDGHYTKPQWCKIQAILVYEK